MRRYHLIVAVVVALLGAVAALAVTKSPVLGLDLQGGTEVVLEAQPQPGQEVTEDVLDAAVDSIRERIDALGVREPEIRKQGDNQIVVQLAGVDPARAAEVIGTTGQLQLFDLEGDLVSPSIDPQGFPIPRDLLFPLLQPLQEGLDEATAGAWYLYDENRNLLAGPEPTKEDILRELEGRVAPEGSEFLGVPGDRVVLTCGENAVVCPGVSASPPTRTYYYLFRYQPDDPERPVPEMTGDDLELGGTRQDFDPQTGEPIVLMQFTDEGEDKFHEVTRELAIRGSVRTGQLGSTEPILQHFAIVLDGEIRSWPSIDFRQYPDGISGSGGAQISGLGSIEEARDLAIVLRSGALPVPFEQVDRTDISATLGEDSLREALVAGIGGLVAVAIFLLLVYRFLGVVAIAGIGIYGALLYGAIVLIPVTLSLPGFAGLILTIGVAADANIVIFERIKEEVQAGKSVRAAISTGYRKGFGTIVDANVVTMITAFVLFAVATAGVKGFALMLLLGTAISMFTAVAATRAMLGLLSNFRWFDNPSFMGATAQKIPTWQRVDFVGKRRVWFALSAVVLVIGIGSLGAQGLNLGIDFEGGSQVSFETPEPTSVERVREVAGAVVPASAVVQGRGEATEGRYTSFQIRTESLGQEEQQRIQDVLVRGLEAESLGIRNVSGSFSSQILRGAILAIAVSLVLIVIYVTVRFQFTFSLPVLAALAHDILLTIGIYSLVQRELTEETVAALLTILGYSIYDTIIIFDRVRENIPLMRQSSFAAIANQSLWETIRRSLATTFSTLLPVSALLVFGGDTLKDFAFALLVGIGSGAYSTIFIATPLLVVLKERQPEFAQRKGQAAPLEKPLDVEAEEEPSPRRAARARRRAGVALPAAGAAPARDGPPPEAAAAPVEAPAEPEAEPEPEAEEVEPAESAQAPAPRADAAARREARRKRRRSRPHGRAR